MKYMLSLLAGLVVMAAGAVEGPRDLFSDTWVCTDGAGRVLPGLAECGQVKTNRTVGIFYWTWHTQRGGPYDNTKLLAEAKNGKVDWTSGPGAAHHWGEPELGYYLETDTYVHMRHAVLLAAAGVDAILFDTTNPPFTWRPEYEALCKCFTELRAQGTRTPSIAFICPFGDPMPVLDQLWKDLYAPGLWKDLWMVWDGKPLIMADVAFAKDPAMREFFTWRKPMPDYRQGPTGPDQWSWLEIAPQHVFKNSRGETEQMSVGVSVNAWPGRPGPAPMSLAAGAMGRSWHAGAKDPAPDAVKRGLFFQEQWERALQVAPRCVFVTGWNEWIAGKMDEWNGYKASECYFPGGLFVDEYNQEYSRDCEPMKGGHGDNYYYQLVANVRRYKGVHDVPHANGRHPIVIDGKAEEWARVEPEFRDAIGDTLHRDHEGYGTLRYTDSTGRNDLKNMKVAHDAKNVFFMAETAAPLTPHTDANWMLLFIDTDQDVKTGWQGYDVLINRNVEASGKKATVERWTAGGWSKAGEARMCASDSTLELAVPRKVLGLDKKAVKFDFHWADNMQRADDLAEFSLHGDSAPERRFNYRFIGEN